MLERAKERKERILSEPPLTRNVGELQWACRDIAGSCAEKNLKEMVDHVKNGISAKHLRIELFKEDGASSESHRKRKITE